MTLKATKLREAISFALAMGATTLAGTGVALAQDQTQPDDASATTLDRIEVLGSRIRRVEGETALPVLTIQREDIEKTGLTQIADVLKEISVNGPSLSLNTNNGNTSGNSSVNLRNCGSNRTLVLVDGKRWVSNNGLGGTVDFSSIPLAAVERIEVLKDGASAIYGSDALCGVINVQTRRNFEGANLRAYNGMYGEGDGYRQAYDLTVGGQGDRWSALVSVGYTKQDPVSAGDREISRVPLFGFPAEVSSPGRASPTGPFGNFPGRFPQTPTNTTGSAILDPSRPGCLPNQDCTAIGDFRAFNFLTDGYNFAPDNYLVQPQETRSIFAQARYDITDNMRIVSDVFYTYREGEAQLAAQPLAPLTISAASVYNPFNAQINGASYRPTDFPRLFGQEQDTWRFSGGLEGTFDLADRSFYWDAGVTYAENRQLNPKNGFYFTSRVNLATGPSFIDTSGVARCGTQAAPITGCVPLNVFGGPAGFTQEMFDYIAVNPKNVAKSDMLSYTANVTGDLFELPAGALAFALGVEHREETGSSEPDPLTALGLVLGDNPFLPTFGKTSVDEAYAELQIPLLRDVAFAKSLELSLAARYSDYNTFGGTTNPKFSLRWQPFDDLLIRGAYGKGFRAPSIGELFAGQGSGRPAAQDPCSATSTAFQQNADVRARCAADGVPAGYVASSSQTRATGGGNPDLNPELSTQRTLGFVYSPSWATGLDFSVDWYKIEISNAIGASGAQTILNDCYIGGDQSACDRITRDLTGATFGNPGEVADILSINRNFIGGLETEGYDVGLGYRFDTDYGNFNVRWDSTYVSYYGDLGQPLRGEVNGDGEISAGNVIGRLPGGSSAGAVRFRLRSQLATTWTSGPWSVTGTLHYMSKVQETCSNVFNTANTLANTVDPSFNDLKNLCSDPNRLIDQYAFRPGTREVIATPTRVPTNVLGSVTYFDIQSSWMAPWNARVTIGARNLFDRDPPFSSDAFANSFDAQYRTPGRFFYLSYDQRF